MEEMSRTLPQGTVLIGQYEIVSVLGEGGFGITYMGRNKDGRTVAVKEYFPSSFAAREAGRLHIFSETKDKFETGKRRFVKEAEVLRQFQYLDGIAAVYECFEENDTAYIVMEYIEGITLKEYVEGQGVLTYNELVSLISPVMRALIQIHRHGVIHRDISPDNIIIGLDNKARLIDFGAAGLINGSNMFNNAESGDNSVVYKTHEISHRGTLEGREKEQGYDSDFGKTVILKAGYAPPEQYIEGGRLGAWTDVYGLAATLYMGITGRAPIDTVERLQRGEKQTGEELYAMLTGSSNEQSINSYNEFSGVERVLPWQAKAILTGLSLAVDDRYSDMGEFYEALTVEPSIEHDVTVMGNGITGKKARYIEKRMKQTGGNRFNLILAVISLSLVIILSIVVGIMITEQSRTGRDDMSRQNLTTDNITSEGDVLDTSTDMEGDNTETKQPVKKGRELSTEIEKNNAEEESLEETTTENTAYVTTGSENRNLRKTTEKNTGENKTTEAIRIHEEDSVEHLDIEE